MTVGCEILGGGASSWRFPNPKEKATRSECKFKPRASLLGACGKAARNSCPVENAEVREVL
jgi:hypothetical protein